MQFDWRKIIVAALCGLAVSVAAHADMVSVSMLDTEHRQPEQACSRAVLLCADLSSPFGSFGTADFTSWSQEFLPEAGADVSLSSEELPPAPILTNGASSLSLCLSALIGLGLCSSTHWVKKLSFGFVPDWYHEGGPFQIGHSLVVSPDSLCPVPLCCFFQQPCVAERLVLSYRSGAIAALWRESQFTPDVVASRGPPLYS